MMTAEDSTRLLETRHDLNAMADLSLVTNNPTYAAALLSILTDLEFARQELYDCVARTALDSDETDQERASKNTSIENATIYYDYVRNNAQSSLFNASPLKPISDAERQRRKKIFARYFETSPSELRAKALAQKTEILTNVSHACSTLPEFKDADPEGELANVVELAILAMHEVQRELRETHVARKNLTIARKHIDVIHRSLILMTDSILTLQGREDEIGQFILRKSTGYASHKNKKTEEPVTTQPVPQLTSDTNPS